METGLTYSEEQGLKYQDWLSEPLDKAYNMGLEHAMKIVKSEIVPTTDINVIMAMTQMKNSIIAKLLTLQR